MAISDEAQSLIGSTAFDRVRRVVAATLGLDEERTASLGPDSAFFGAVPELDSLAVLEVVAALEAEFDVSIDEDDITGEAFESMGSLAHLVQSAHR